MLTVVDVTGEEVTLKELIKRLKFRQYYPLQSGNLPVLQDLNLRVCYDAGLHSAGIEDTSEVCSTCGLGWQYLIKNGVLCYPNGRTWRRRP